MLAALLVSVEPLHAEYRKIQLRVYGLDCGLCARGVAASVQRLAGVKSVDVDIKKGMVDIVLVPGNKFKMTDLRKRIRENGFRPVEGTVTAVGEFTRSSNFEVVGSGESYDIGAPGSNTSGLIERTFKVK
jgi:copper chaperone CopZ